jgi:hypothetical protein
MAKKRVEPATVALTPPQVFEATLAANGAVVKGLSISQRSAEQRRKGGLDVVVCGPNLSANRQLAGLIESNANGSVKRCPPHASAGIHALPHYQPDPRPPGGHTFYETPKRKAV